jgi:predicted phosphodiesterase
LVYPIDEYKYQILSLHEQGFNATEIVQKLNLNDALSVSHPSRAVRRALARWAKEGYGEADESVENLIEDANNLLSPNDGEDSLKKQIYILESQNRKLKNLVRAYNKKTSLEEQIAQQIISSVKSTPYSPTLMSNASGVWTPKKSTHRKEMLLLVSDAHYPEVVNPAEALGIKYDSEVCINRMQHITNTTVDIVRDRGDISKLTIAVVGDMLSGNIHEELEITNEKPIGEALTEMVYMLLDMGIIFSEVLPGVNIEFIILPGNHPRLTKKPRAKQRFDNFEYIMGQFLKGVAGDKFTVTVPKDIIYTHNIMGYKIGMTHGDGSKAASFAGIPFYGLSQRTKATQSMRSLLGLDRLYMFLMGHYHQLLNWTDGDCHIVVNGSIKGGDEYSIVSRSSALEPVQALLTFHETHGWVNLERIPLGHII